MFVLCSNKIGRDQFIIKPSGLYWIWSLILIFLIDLFLLPHNTQIKILYYFSHLSTNIRPMAYCPLDDIGLITHVIQILNSSFYYDTNYCSHHHRNKNHLIYINNHTYQASLSEVEPGFIASLIIESMLCVLNYPYVPYPRMSSLVKICIFYNSQTFFYQFSAALTSCDNVHESIVGSFFW